MAKGIISGFIGGGAQGMADAGKMMFANQLAQERDEANDTRRRAMQTQRQGFLTGEREEGQTWKEGESQLDRESAQGIADTKAKAVAAKDGSTNVMKNAAYYESRGYPKAVADAAAGKNFKDIEDKDTGDAVLINTLTGKEVGRLTSGGTSGAKEWVPAGGQTENAPITKEHRATARETAEEKAGWFSGDTADFPETGSEKAFAKKEAQRIANEQRGGAKSGIVKSAVDIDRSVPKTAMPAPKESAPKAALDWLKRNPDKLPLFIEKYGYDPTKT